VSGYSDREVDLMTEPDPRTDRYAVPDVDYTTLPDPVTLEHTVIEQPASWDVPTGGAWDSGAGGDGGAGGHDGG
jgi:hypothetical protein